MTIKMFRLTSRILKTKRNWSSISTCKFQVHDEKLSPVIKTSKQWAQPEGFDTGIKVYNEFLKEKVPLIVMNKGMATWYSCGPTVYADAHIGHASCYVKFDIVRKILTRIFNIDVVMLMGITDIDDKIIRRAEQENCSIQEVSKKYEIDFFRDMAALNVESPTIITRVTEFIPKIVSFCEALLAKDFAYVTTEGNVYFIVSKVEYEVDEQAESELSSVIDPLKRDPRDFALWKAAKPGEPSWPSPWGNGRPGWHIECSAMASHVFGSKIDIHTGGSDLCFPHHANENSQCEAYHGNTQWVNYWMHSGLLQLGDDVKMSKSLGNTLSIKDFLSDHSANVFRMMCLQSHYRNAVQYSDVSLELARNVYFKLHNFLNDAELYISKDLNYKDFDVEPSNFVSMQESVIVALSDDFNTSRALKCIIDVIGDTNKYFKPTNDNLLDENVAIVAAISTYIDNTLNVLGIDILCKKKMPASYNHFIDTVVNFRHHVRMCALANDLEVSNTVPDSNFAESEVFKESLMTLTNSLESYGLAFHPDIGFSVANDARFKKSKFGSFSDNVKNVLRDLSTFYQNITSHTSNLNDISIKSDYQKDNIPLKRYLLKECDNFRNSLNSSEICVKDIKRTSVWYPLDKIMCANNLHKK